MISSSLTLTSWAVTTIGRWWNVVRWYDVSGQKQHDSNSIVSAHHINIKNGLLACASFLGETRDIKVILQPEGVSISNHFDRKVFMQNKKGTVMFTVHQPSSRSPLNQEEAPSGSTQWWRCRFKPPTCSGFCLWWKLIFVLFLFLFVHELNLEKLT